VLLDLFFYLLGVRCAGAQCAQSNESVKKYHTQIVTGKRVSLNLKAWN
jgi:hypothetical protein